MYEYIAYKRHKELMVAPQSRKMIKKLKAECSKKKLRQKIIFYEGNKGVEFSTLPKYRILTQTIKVTKIHSIKYT